VVSPAQKLFREAIELIENLDGNDARRFGLESLVATSIRENDVNGTFRLLAEIARLGWGSPVTYCRA